MKKLLHHNIVGDDTLSDEQIYGIYQFLEELFFIFESTYGMRLRHYLKNKKTEF